MDAHNRDDGEEQLLDMIRGGDINEEDFSSQFLNDSGEGAEEEASGVDEPILEREDDVKLDGTVEEGGDEEGAGEANCDPKLKGLAVEVEDERFIPKAEEDDDP